MYQKKHAYVVYRLILGPESVVNRNDIPVFLAVVGAFGQNTLGSTFYVQSEIS